MKIRYIEKEKPPIRSAYARDFAVGMVISVDVGGRQRFMLRTQTNLVDLADPSYTLAVSEDPLPTEKRFTNYEIVDAEVVIHKK